MAQKLDDPTPKVPSYVLGAVCFITVFMCQTRFKIIKEIRPNITPPLLKTNYVSLFYSFGKPDRFRLEPHKSKKSLLLVLVLRTFVAFTSPVLSLLASGLVLLGKQKSNPYLFMPWFFFTLKGLLLIQSQNLYSILNELFTRYDQTYPFAFEDWKWSTLYFTIFFFNIAESFAIYEVFEIFKILWNRQYIEANEEPIKLEAHEIRELDHARSLISLRSISSESSKLDEFHTITSVCNFTLFSDKATKNSLSKLKSLVALFRKK